MLISHFPALCAEMAAFLRGRIGYGPGTSSKGKGKGKAKGKAKGKGAHEGFFGGDFPELLPPPMHSDDDDEEEWDEAMDGKGPSSQTRPTAAANGKGKEREKARQPNTWNVAGMTPPEQRRGLLALPMDVYDSVFFQCLGQKELCRLHATCKVGAAFRRKGSRKASSASALSYLLNPRTEPRSYRFLS